MNVFYLLLFVHILRMYIRHGLEYVNRGYDWLQDKLSRIGVVLETLIRPEDQLPVCPGIK
jgi:hypothetical protein